MDLVKFRELDEYELLSTEIKWDESVWFHVEMFEVARKFFASKKCIHVGIYLDLGTKHGKMFLEWVTTHLKYDPYVYDKRELIPINGESAIKQMILFFPSGSTCRERNTSLTRTCYMFMGWEEP